MLDNPLIQAVFATISLIWVMVMFNLKIRELKEDLVKKIDINKGLINIKLQETPQITIQELKLRFECYTKAKELVLYLLEHTDDCNGDGLSLGCDKAAPEICGYHCLIIENSDFNKNISRKKTGTY